MHLRAVEPHGGVPTRLGRARPPVARGPPGDDVRRRYLRSRRAVGAVATLAGEAWAAELLRSILSSTYLES